MKEKPFVPDAGKLARLKELLAADFTLPQAAKSIGIRRTTAEKYRKCDPELDRMILEQERAADDDVEKALLKRATGYENPDGKEVPPDVRAAVFWLKNRRPENWKDRRDLSVAGPVKLELLAEEEKL